MDPIEASMQGSGGGAAANGGGEDASMMALLADGLDDDGPPAAPPPPQPQQQEQQQQAAAAIAAAMAQQQQQQQQQAPAAAAGFGDLIVQFRMDRGANGLAPPAPAAAPPLQQQQPLGGAGAKRAAGRKGSDDDDDDDEWQPGARGAAGKKARTAGAAAGAAAAPPGVGPGASPFAGQTLADVQARAAWDGQPINAWAGAGAQNPLLALQAFGRGGMFGGAGFGGAGFGGGGLDPMQAAIMLQQQQQQQALLGLQQPQQQLLGQQRLYGFGAPGALGGALPPLGRGAGALAPVAGGRGRGPAFMMQAAAPPEPESHEADELLSKCEQISASLHAALKTRPIKIKKKKLASSDGGAGPVKSEDGGPQSGGGAAPRNGAPEVKEEGGVPGIQVVSDTEEDGADEGDLVSRGPRLEAATGPAAAYLKPYQLVGINFLLLLYRQKVGGAILADEMGLGKTAQAICFLGALADWENDRGPHLVCAPASLLDNWAREIGHWCPNLRVLTYHGNSRDETRARLESWRAKVAEALDSGELQQAPSGYVRPGEEGANDPVDNKRGDESDDDDSEAESDSEEEPDGVASYLSRTKEVLDEDDHNVTSGLGAFDVMLTTYSMFERESKRHTTDRAFLRKWKWSQVVMDEAHALKNAASSRARRLRRLALTARGRLMLTGTPLQNDLIELNNLLTFLLPNVFAGQGMDEAVLEAGKDPEKERQLVERMRTLLQPFVLRRLKNELKDQLVEKELVMREVEMTAEQTALYKQAIEKMRKEVQQFIRGRGGPRGRGSRSGLPLSSSTNSLPQDDDDVGGMRRTRRNTSGGGGRGGASDSDDDARGTTPGSAMDSGVTGGGVTGDGGAGDGVPRTRTNAAALLAKLGSSRINNIFTHLRKIAQHPLLVRHRYSDAQVAEMAQIAAANNLFAGQCTLPRVTQEFMGYSDYQLHTFSITYYQFLGAYALPPDSLLSSGKLVELDKLLRDLRDRGSRVLIFSQWTSVLDILEWFLHERGMLFYRLDGSTNVSDRLSIVDSFNDPASPAFAFLLSTRAGGQGLNLTGADTVILHDVDFNPQVDRQAEDRCHRLGQTRKVTVYRMVCNNTVDADIYAIQQRKLRLDAAVLEGVTISTSAEPEGGRGRGRGRGGRGRGGVSAADARHMGAILAALLGDEDEEQEEAAGGV